MIDKKRLTCLFAIVAGFSCAISAPLWAKSVGSAVKNEVSPQSCRLEVRVPGTTEYRAFCSGTLIGPKAIATAAHCKAEDFSKPEMKAAQFQARCGVLTQDKKTGAVLGFQETLPFKLDHFKVDPAYSAQGAGQSRDVAFIELDRAAAITPAIAVDAQDSKGRMADIIKNKSAYRCRSEGFGTNRVETSYLLQLIEETSDEKRNKLAEEMVTNPAVVFGLATSYELELDGSDLEAAKKSKFLKFDSSFEFDFDKLKSKSPKRHEAMTKLFKIFEEKWQEVRADSTLTREEKIAALVELGQAGYTLLLVQGADDFGFYASSLWGDSGGGQLCQELKTGKTFLVSVTSQINVGQHESDSTSAAKEPELPETLFAGELKGKGKIEAGTVFAPLSFNPGVFDPAAAGEGLSGAPQVVPNGVTIKTSSGG